MRQAKTKICSTGKGIGQNQKTWLRFIFVPSKTPIFLKENTVVAIVLHKCSKGKPVAFHKAKSLAL